MYYDRYDDYDFYALFACEELNIGVRKCLIMGRVSYYGVMDYNASDFSFFPFLCFAEGHELIMVGEDKRLEATLMISVHPSFVLNRQTSCSMTRKPMIVSFFLEWSLSGEWSVVAVRTCCIRITHS